jgi:hypothetical protein
MDGEWTPERFKKELLGGPARWLFSVLAVVSLALLVWAPFEDDMEVFFPIHLRQKGVIVASAISFLVYAFLAAINWSRHARK